MANLLTHAHLTNLNGKFELAASYVMNLTIVNTNK